MLGGNHTATDNNVGLAVDRRIEDYTWLKIQSYFDGTGKVHEGWRR
jgi:hypothetical protein